MSPVGLGELLRSLPQNQDPNLLVGFDTSDDAAVYRLDDDTALVLTADIITPPVDDPRRFGQIAAANSLSDVYAMGGRPLVCLNLIAFPDGKLGPEILHGIVAGAAETVAEAGAVIGGGHSLQDEEPKFGLSVAGLVRPDRVWTNAGARTGDALVLTKPLGGGVLLNANRKGWVSQAAMEACLETMATLNRAAAEVAQGFEIHAATDVTGFGLAGHGLEMAQASGVQLVIEVGEIPLLPEAVEMYRRGMTTGSNRANRELVAAVCRFQRPLSRPQEEILFDPQTSGGLLFALPADQAPELLRSLAAAEVTGSRIGRVEPFDGRHRLVFT